MANVDQKIGSTRKPHGERKAAAAVIELSAVRETRKRDIAERRVRAVMDDNRAALNRLFASGLIFTQKGSRAARDLLLAHQSLLKVVDVFARLGEAHGSEDAVLKVRAEEVFARLDAQLARTTQLTARTGEFLSGHGSE